MFLVFPRKILPLRFPALCRSVQSYPPRAAYYGTGDLQGCCMGFRYPWKIERYLCFWLAEARPIVHLYSKSHSLLSQKQIVFTLMIALYHKMCTIIWTYRTRPTIRNSSSGDAGFGAYALLYDTSTGCIRRTPSLPR